MKNEPVNQLILNFLDRVLNENIKNAESILAIKFALEEQKDQLTEVLEEIENKLKEDIHKYIVEDGEKTRDLLEKVLKDYERSDNERQASEQTAMKINSFVEGITKRGNLIKWTAIIFASLATIIGSIVAIENGFLSHLGIVPPKNNSVQTPDINRP